MTETPKMLRRALVVKVTFLVLFAAVILVFVLQYDPFKAAVYGRLAAEADWKNGTAILCGERPTSITEGEMIYSWGAYDPESGLSTCPPGTNGPLADSERYVHQAAYDRAYCQRVRQLLKGNGIPSWSMKEHLVSKEVMAELFASDKLRRATTFPFAIDQRYALEIEIAVGTEQGPEHFFCPNYFYITVDQQGSTAKSGAQGPAAMKSQHGKTFPFLFGMPLFVGIHPDYPDTVFIRQGNSWLVAIYKGDTVVGRVGRKVDQSQ